ncbi:MAG: hypothetical protein GX021_09090 [Tissierellia bacterium]|nr:hypothetical protein [Tissierellia bacterium]
MKKKILAILLVIAIVFLSVACKEDKEENVLLPPEEDEHITFKTTSLVYQNGGSTNYSIGKEDGDTEKYIIACSISLMLIVIPIYLIPFIVS